MLDPVTRLVPVLVDLPEDARPAAEQGTRLPGAPVRVLVQVGEMKGWLAPRDAVLTDAKGPYIFQVSGSKATRVDVRVEGTAGDTTVISGPLEPTRPLVVSGNYQLQDGGVVRERQASAARTAP
jgi:membrane fusion protein, multidrug efflux system